MNIEVKTWATVAVIATLWFPCLACVALWRIERRLNRLHARMTAQHDALDAMAEETKKGFKTYNQALWVLVKRGRNG